MPTFHRMFGAVLAALVAAAGVARAESAAPRQPDQGAKPSQPEPDGSRPSTARRLPEQDPKPLSPEDAALVRELALLERVELLKHLELFEPAGSQRGRAQKNGAP